MFDAACVWPNGKVYFFRGAAYAQYDIAADRVDPGFPRRIRDGWPGVFADGVDAAAVWPDGSAFGGKAYFFRGDEYVRFDVAAGRADPGYPRRIGDGGWPGVFAAGVDAVAVGPAGTAWAGKAFFFRGDEYVQYDIEADAADGGYPRKIAGDWPGLFAAGVDAACVWPAGDAYGGKVYFFRGAEYLRYDAEAGRADDGYPARIDGGSWGGLTAGLWDSVQVWGFLRSRGG